MNFKSITLLVLLAVTLLAVNFKQNFFAAEGYFAQADLFATDYKYKPIEWIDTNSYEAKLLFVGDTMMGRYVRTLINKNGHNYPFAKLPENFFTGYDLIVANLEGPITDRYITGGTSMIFGFPVDTAEILKGKNIGLVSLANNHILDRGAEGYTETTTALSDAGIDYVGHFNIEDAEHSLRYKEINGLKLAFIAVHDATRRLNEEAVKNLIKEADANSDYVIVMPHWGIEYKTTAGTRQTQLAHDWIDSGADLIVGHHPHVVQNIEEYNGKTIFYSLGNFIFDQYWSAETQKELAVVININKESISYSRINLKSKVSQPELVEDAK